MISSLKLDELKKRLTRPNAEFGSREADLPKMPNILTLEELAGLSPHAGWEQDDLYFLYHLPESCADYVREKMAGYREILLVEELANNLKQESYISAKDHFLRYIRTYVAFTKLTLTLESSSHEAEKLRSLQSMQMKYIYLLLVAIKNFLLVQAIRIKTMPKVQGNKTDLVLKEANYIEGELSGAKEVMLDLVGYASSRLEALVHDESARGFVEEVSKDFEFLEKQLAAELLKRSLFPDVSADKLQTMHRVMQTDFSDLVTLESSSGLFFCFSCIPCISFPEKSANQKLIEMRLIELKADETSSWAVLGLFFEARKEVEESPNFKSLMDKCFEKALSVKVDAVPLEARHIAEEQLAAYRQSKSLPNGSILKEREMQTLGYRRL
ncbi:MAG: hypothetical protein ACHQAX_04810 [Gammaproteobacteria bacterium]